MASAQVDGAAAEEVIVQDKKSAEESHVAEQNLPENIEGSVGYEEEDDEVGGHESEGEVKNFEDEENLDNKIADSPIIGEDEPNSTFDDDDDAEEDEENEKI